MTTIDLSNIHQWLLKALGETLMGISIIDESCWQYLYPLVLLFFYLCHNKYHKFGNLKQHKFNISQFFKWAVQNRLISFSTSDIIKPKSKCQPARALTRRFWDERTPTFIQLVDRIQFLIVVGLRYLSFAGCRLVLPLALRSHNSQLIIKCLI